MMAQRHTPTQDNTMSNNFDRSKVLVDGIVAHYHLEKLNIDEWLETRLANIPLITPDFREYLHALIILGERESVVPSGYSQAEMCKMAEEFGHKQGYLYALSYLENICPTPEESKK